MWSNAHLHGNEAIFILNLNLISSAGRGERRRRVLLCVVCVCFRRVRCVAYRRGLRFAPWERACVLLIDVHLALARDPRAYALRRRQKVRDVLSKSRAARRSQRRVPRIGYFLLRNYRTFTGL